MNTENVVLQVKYAALPNFEEREEDFRAESVLLRRRFTDEGRYLSRHQSEPQHCSHSITSPSHDEDSPCHICTAREEDNLVRAAADLLGMYNKHAPCFAYLYACAAEEGDSLVRAAEDKLPGQALPLSMQRLWQIIREQKDLNLPAHKVPWPQPASTSPGGAGISPSSNALVLYIACEACHTASGTSTTN